jgi:hypothetical protein
VARGAPYTTRPRFRRFAELRAGPAARGSASSAATRGAVDPTRSARSAATRNPASSRLQRAAHSGQAGHAVGSSRDPARAPRSRSRCSARAASRPLSASGRALRAGRRGRRPLTHARRGVGSPRFRRPWGPQNCARRDRALSAIRAGGGSALPATSSSAGASRSASPATWHEACLPARRDRPRLGAGVRAPAT